MDWFPWIVTAVGAPAIGTMFIMILINRSNIEKLKTDVEERFGRAREERITQIAETKAMARVYTEENRRAVDMQMIVFRDEFKDHQLKSLDTFVQYRAFKDFEERMMMHFGKIDEKLEKIANGLHR